MNADGPPEAGTGKVYQCLIGRVGNLRATIDVTGADRRIAVTESNERIWATA